METSAKAEFSLLFRKDVSMTVSYIEQLVLSALLWLLHFLRSPEANVLDQLIEEIAVVLEQQAAGQPAPNPTPNPTPVTTTSDQPVATDSALPAALRAKQSSVPN
jgi:hypothetical protein